MSALFSKAREAVFLCVFRAPAFLLLAVLDSANLTCKQLQTEQTGNLRWHRIPASASSSSPLACRASLSRGRKAGGCTKYLAPSLEKHGETTNDR